MMWFLSDNITLEYLIIRIFVILCIVFFVFPIKQYFYAYTADKFGDDIPRITGKLTINPYVHFDLLGALGILLFGFGWPKSVPVNIKSLKDSRKKLFLLALTVSITHIVAAILGIILFGVLKFIVPFVYVPVFSMFFNLYIHINVMLATYEFLPIEPFKGSLILQAILPQKALEYYEKNYRIISLVICFLLLFGMFSGPLSFLEKVIYNFIVKLTFFAKVF